MDFVNSLRRHLDEVDDTNECVSDLSTWIPNSIYARRAYGDYWDEHLGQPREIIRNAIAVIAAMLDEPDECDIQVYREEGEIPEKWDILNVDNYLWYSMRDEEGEFTHNSPVNEDYHPEHDTLAKAYRALYNQKLELLRQMANQKEDAK